MRGKPPDMYRPVLQVRVTGDIIEEMVGKNTVIFSDEEDLEGRKSG